MSKTIYNYAPETGLFLGASLADESPLEPGVYLIPGFATDIEPPAPGERQAVAFKDGEWALIPDWRGVTLYSTETGQQERIEEPGVTPADRGLTDLQPPACGTNQAAVYRNGAWEVVPDWRGATLCSTDTGERIEITELGTLPADAGATDQPRPSDVHAWNGKAWTVSKALIAEKLVKTKAEAQAAIDRHHETTIQQLVGNPTQVEKDTWALKLETANAVSAGQAPSPAGAAFLQAAGLQDAKAQAAWAATVLKKSAGYAAVVGLAERLRDQAKTAVKAADTIEAIQQALVEQKAAAEAAVAKILAV